MKTKLLTETGHGTGAIRLGHIHHGYRRLVNSKLGKAGVPFDWNKGYDTETLVGKITIKNQGESSSCGGQAMAYGLEILERLANKSNEEISAKSMYSPIAYSGGGTTISDVETQFATRSGNKEIDVPSYQNGQTPSEAFMEDKSWVTPILTKDAFARAGYTPIDVSIDIESFAEAIRDYGFVLVEIAGQDNGTWRSPYPIPPQKANRNPIWYHYMCFGKGARIMNGVQQIDAYQSWGADVGDSGVQHFKSDYINPKYMLEAIAFIKDSELKPLPTNTSVWASVCEWFRQLWGLDKVQSQFATS